MNYSEYDEMDVEYDSNNLINIANLKNIPYFNDVNFDIMVDKTNNFLFNITTAHSSIEQDIIKQSRSNENEYHCDNNKNRNNRNKNKNKNKDNKNNKNRDNKDNKNKDHQDHKDKHNKNKDKNHNKKNDNYSPSYNDNNQLSYSDLLDNIIIDDNLIEYESNDDNNKCNNPQCDHSELKEYEFTNRQPIEINNIDDLIELGKQYHCKKNRVYFGINLRILCNLVEPLTKLKSLIGMKTVKENIVNQIIFFLQGFNERE